VKLERIFSAGLPVKSTATSYALDNLGSDAGGKVAVYGFIAEEAVGNGTVKFYVAGTETGTLSTLKAALFAAASTFGPTGAAIQTVSAAFATGASGTSGWAVVTMTGITLLKGNRYVLVIYNETGTPASNYMTMALAGGVGQGFSDSASTTTPRTRMYAGYGSAGWTGALTLLDQPACLVIMYPTNNWYGSPFGQLAIESYNGYQIGNKVVFSEAVTLNAILLHFLSMTAVTAISIYDAGLGLVYTQAVDPDDKNINGLIQLTTEQTLEGGAEYYIVVTSTTAAARYVAKHGIGTMLADTAYEAVKTGASFGNGVRRWSFASRSGSVGLFTLAYDKLFPMLLYFSVNPTREPAILSPINRGMQ
jgi:hypothetical protein